MNYPPVCRIKGTSMYPLLKEGELVFLDNLERVMVGDIVVYSAREEYIIHRVIALKQEMVITQGDNSFQRDPPVAKDQLLALVKWKLLEGEKVRLSELPKKGRCGSDALDNPDIIFQFLTKQFLKGLGHHVDWITSNGETLPMENVRLQMLESTTCQQLVPPEGDRIESYLASTLNTILQYLTVQKKDGGEIIGLRHRFSQS